MTERRAQPPRDEPASFDPLATLDPDIATFVRQMTQDAAAHPRRDRVPVTQAREIAEGVRKRWTAGGPAMAEISDHVVPTRHGDLPMRLYRPNDRATGPALVYLPGGGWTLFSIDTHDRLMREYAARTGMVVLGLDYSRAPEAKFPQAIEEIRDATLWLGTAGAALGINPDALLIGGDSAGANLAVAVSLHLRDEGQDAYRGMVLNYGVFDPNSLRASGLRFGAGDLPLSSHLMQWFTWQYIRSDADLTDPRLRVLSADLSHLPPAMMVVADHDILLDENLDMARALKAAGVSVELKVYQGTVHSFLEAMSIAPVAVRALDDTARWIKDIAALRAWEYSDEI
ncbi:alpha/beta hydrolase [Pseudooceanicola algae]|uniref:Acetyl esterase n=1 Tax=Pseudooceanicola algae TaxID=1537215 RepID=A0A418SJ23_9RHOB|nr:alpha/beta hydrolase [Pseudooceanicola algae]QPM91988.1 Acetyl esterase [Pseudooceanicola algae]